MTQAATVVQFKPSGSKMSRSKKYKRPMDPAEIARRAAILVAQGKDPSRWGIDPALLALPVNEDVDTSRDAAGRVSRAMRWDVFELMRMRSANFPLEHYEAVRRLQRDIAILHRTQGGSGALGAMGQAAEPLQAWMTEDFSIARVLAALRLNGRPPTENWPDGELGVLARMTPWCAALLLALSENVISGGAVNWQATVRRITGETDRLRRAALVKQAAANLAAAYAMGSDRRAVA